jgi:GntR family transcriptional regulator
MLRGERHRWNHPDEAPIALVSVYVNSTYGLIRPQLSKLTEALASVAERVLNVRVRRIVQELQPKVLDVEAARLAAPVGSPAMLVWRWYYLDNDDLLIISRSIYPQGRMVFRTELNRAE